MRLDAAVWEQKPVVRHTGRSVPPIARASSPKSALYILVLLRPCRARTNELWVASGTVRERLPDRTASHSLEKSYRQVSEL